MGSVLPAGAMRLITALKAGRSSADLSTGMRRKKDSTVGKKAENRLQNPYVSSTKPGVGEGYGGDGSKEHSPLHRTYSLRVVIDVPGRPQPYRITRKPARKHADPL